MAEKITIARPYAQAVFELAVKEQKLPAWSETLRLLAAVASAAAMRQVIGNPRLTQAQIAGVFFDIGGDGLGRPAKALISLLAANRRLDLLPEIAALYEEYRAEAEKVVQAEVVSAFPLDDGQRAAIADALKRRLGRAISLTCKTDESLIGGAVVRAGDLVIDGSVTGHLGRLGSALSR